jgi:hypothetical protein
VPGNGEGWGGALDAGAGAVMPQDRSDRRRRAGARVENRVGLLAGPWIGLDNELRLVVKVARLGERRGGLPFHHLGVPGGFRDLLALEAERLVLIVGGLLVVHHRASDAAPLSSPMRQQPSVAHSADRRRP